MRVTRALALFGVAVSLSGAFGVADRVLQGQSVSGAGWYLANVAGVWLAVAFAFGALARTRGEAALVGLAAELAALVGYYGYKHFIQHQAEPHSHYLVWFTCAVLAAPLFGLMGYRWRRRRSQIAGLLLGSAFVCEALFLWLAQDRPRRVVAAETLAGVLLAVALAFAARWRRDHHYPREHRT